MAMRQHTPRSGTTWHRIGEDRGAAAVELALLLPMLGMLLAGIVDLGSALWQYHTAVKANRDAVRYLSRTPEPWNDPTYQTQATNLAKTGSLAAGGTPLATNIGVDFQYPVASGASAYNGSDRVIIGVVHFDYAPFTGFGFLPVVTLRAAHIERHIGE